MPSGVMGFSCISSSFRFATREDLHELADRIEELVHNALLQRNDRVIRDRNVLRTHLRASLGDVAVADSVRLTKLRHPVGRVERMHLQRRGVRQEAWSN